jgi:hypothetical protein
MKDKDFGPVGTLVRGGWFKILDAEGNVLMEGKQPEVVVPVQLKEIV